MAAALFVGLHGCTAATVLLTIVFLALDEGLDAGWRDQPNVMARLADLKPPKVSAATSFHRGEAGRQGRKSSGVCARLCFVRSTARSAPSTRWTRNTFCARSSPTVTISEVTARLCLPADLSWHRGALGRGRLRHQGRGLPWRKNSGHGIPGPPVERRIRSRQGGDADAMRPDVVRSV